jgi:hypothetical protein
MILDLHRQGLLASAIAGSWNAIARRCTNALKRGLEASASGPRQPRPTVVTPFARISPTPAVPVTTRLGADH